MLIKWHPFLLVAERIFYMSKKVTVRLFTSESVCAGHPDKIADAISDAVVDAVLEADPKAHTAIETVAGANQIALYG